MKASLPVVTLLSLSLWACSRQAPVTIPPESALPTPVEAPRSSGRNDGKLNATETARLAEIGEKAPANDQQVWLQKNFWLNREIWLSLGVERASLTGLAMSVYGYIPARVERHGLKLVLVRRNDGLFGGSTLGPDFPIQAYPITGESDDALLVDLASPLTKYGLTTIGFSEGESASELAPRLEYLKSIEVGTKSLALHTVAIVQSPKALYDEKDGSAESLVEQDRNLLALSLRTDWVLDAPTPGFAPLAAGDLFGFFETAPLARDGGTRSEAFVNRISTAKPFVWEITPNTPDDFRDAVKQGVEMWNASLGAGVLQARIGDGSRSFTDPSVSNMVWDDNRAVGMAFANWRENPYTGEVIQAQVYMSGEMWAQNGLLTHQIRMIEKRLRAMGPTPSAPASTAALRADIARVKKEVARLDREEKKARRFSLAFTAPLATEHARRNAFCLRSVDTAGLRRDVEALERLLEQPGVNVATSSSSVANHMPYPPENQTSQDFAKNVVRAVVFHEVGHTLGLRHNFIASKGTTDNGRIESASIMDYNDLVVDASFDRPGDSDAAILAWGYSNVPANNVAFCTDEHAGAGIPDCQPFDHGSEPVEGLRVREETNLMIAYQLLMVGNTSSAISLLNQAIRTSGDRIAYVVAPTDEVAQFLGDSKFGDRQKKAWDLLQDSRKMLGLPYPGELQAEYSQLLTQILARKVSAATSASALFEPIVETFVQTALDADGGQQLATRKEAVSGLVRLQHFRARKALRDLETLVAQQSAAANRDPEQAEEDDEVARAIRSILQQGYFKP